MIKAYLTITGAERPLHPSMYKDGCVSLQMNDTLLFVCHGTEEGKVVFRGHELTTLEFAERSLAYYRSIGVNHVFTLTCYGGCQPPVRNMGLLVQSLHMSKKPIGGHWDPKVPNKNVFTIELDDIGQYRQLKTYCEELNLRSSRYFFAVCREELS